MKPYLLEIWVQKEVKRELISTKQSDFPFPYLPTGAKYHFHKTPYYVIDSIVSHDEVRRDDEWVDEIKHIIVLAKHPHY